MTRRAAACTTEPQRFARIHDARLPDIVLIQVLKSAVGKLSTMAAATGRHHALRAVSFACADISDVPVSALRWDLLALDRSSRRSKEVISLAKPLRDERYQSTSAGGGPAECLLLRMDLLFQENGAKARETGSCRVRADDPG